MQLKATKLAAILSRLHSALRVPSALALFAAFGLCAAAPLTAKAECWVRFTITKKYPAQSDMDTSGVALGRFALYDASGNLLNDSLVKTELGSSLTDGHFWYDSRGWNKNSDTTCENIFKASMADSSKMYYTVSATAGKKLEEGDSDYHMVFTMRLSGDIMPVKYNLATADSNASLQGRYPTSWKVETSTTGGDPWTVVSEINNVTPPTTSHTWYNGGGTPTDAQNPTPPSTFYPLATSSTYTPIEYIKTTRHQSAINTGYCPNPRTWMEVCLAFSGDFQISGTRPEGTTGTFFGCLADANNVTYSANFGGESTQSAQVFVWAEKNSAGVTSDKYKSKTFNATATIKSKNTITFCNGSFNWGSETLNPLTKTTTCTNPLYILGTGGSSGPSAFGAYEMTVYSWKIYESDDGQKGGANQRLLHNYVPVKNSSGVPGLYDLVTGEFYSSTSGTDFEAGDNADPSTLTFLERLALDSRRVAADADPSATGGDIILKDGEDYIHIFSQVGSSMFTVNNACYATALLVGGGGGGGANDGGGGGAGGMVEVLPMDLSPYTGQSVTVTVGAGAEKVTDPGHGKNGSSSSIEGIATAYGGGGGGYWNDKAGNGGEGCGSGGGSCGGNATGTAGTPGVSTTTYAEVKQGNDGGKGSEIGHGPAGGGGGAGLAAAAVTHNQYGGNGGVGRVCSILGGDFATQCFAGGGGGGSVESGDYHSSGGSGGGGDGASSSSSAAKSGEDGLGGGGGGGIGGATRDAHRGDGAAGGSGIVIIRVSERAAIPDVSTLTVTLSGASATYTGSSVEPNITITDAGGTTLFSAVKASAITGQGFTAEWKKGGSVASVQNAGTYTLTLTGDGATYTGTADKGTFTVNKKMATTPVAVVTTYTGSTQDAPIKDASGNNLKGSIWDYASTGSGAQQSGKGEHTVKVQLHDANNYTYTDGATTTTFKWTITDVKCTCSTYSSWTPGENNILLGKVAEVTGYGVGNESTAGVAVLTDGANPISSTNPTNAERCELKGNGETTLIWVLGGQATVSELRVFVGVGDTSWGHANINITKLEYYDMTAGEWKELKFFAQTMPYYVNNTKQVKAVISRDNGNLFENATQLRITMSAPIYINNSAYYSSLTEIEAIGEVHATPIPEENLPRLAPQRTFKYNGNPQSVSLSDATYVDIVAGDGTGTTTAMSAGVYYVWVQPKPGYVWPDDESSAPRKYEWGIVPSGYTEPFGTDRSFLKTLENSPYRVAASALPPGISGGDIFLRFPNVDGEGNIVSHDFVHVFTNTAASGFVFENSSGSPRQGRALIVGGGGASGYTMKQNGTRDGHITGGGGGGGGVRSIRNLQLNGAYSIWVGHGGIPAGQQMQGTNGEASKLQNGSVSYVVAGGGGGGKSSVTAGDSVSKGLSGASGGGGAGTNGTGGAGDGDGYGGGEAKPYSTWTGSFVGAGGGGAGRSGFAGCGQGESGGYGFLTDILASPGVVSQYICLGGGGAGGGDGESTHGKTLGGFGGGGNSYVNTTENNGETGVNGLGGGAGADSMSAAGPYGGNGSSKRGGDGIVIIRYTDTVQTPKINEVEIPVIEDTYTFDFGRHDVLLKDSDVKLADTEYYTVSGDLGGVYIQDYTVTLTLRDPDNMQWSNGQTQPQTLTWSIVHDKYDDDRSFFKVLATNHNRIATAPLGLTADIVLRSEQIHDSTRYYRYELVYKDSASITFNTAINGAEVLLVGGGGAGGNGNSGDGSGGGGGGAGGVKYVKDVSFAANQAYALQVGQGGQSASANGAASTINTASGTLTAGGGGGGGWYAANGNDSALGSAGGGGGSGKGGTAQDANLGHNGGNGYNGGGNSGGGAGGGAGGQGQPGGNQEEHSAVGRGGNGVQAAIFVSGGLESQYFGGGGAGGYGGSSERPPCSGGLGGGGSTWPRTFGTNEPGVDGLGGGGAGGSATGAANNPGRPGGDGIIVIAFEIPAGTFIDKPTLGTDRFTYSGNEVVVTDYLSSFAHMTATGTDRATNVGDYQFAVTPASGYEWSDNSGTVAVPFEWSIAAKPIQGNITVPAIPAQTYTGSPITPSFTVRDTARNVVLTLGTDYTAEYVGNVNIGTATIKLTGTGNYTGVETATFQIVADPNVTGYYVTADADGSGDGTGWASPFTLQQAFNAIAANAAVGTTNAIYMKVGTYKNTTGPWTAAPNKRCFIHVLGGYLGVNLARSTTEYTVLDGEGERGLVSVTVNISQSSTDHGKWILFDQIKFYRGKQAYYINVADGKGNYFSRFVNCRFIDNIAPAGDTNIRGSAIEVKGMSLPWVENCEFRGNKACTQYATTIFAAEPVSNWYYGLTLMNSLFVGNSSQVRPCVAHFGASENNNITIKSCTFAYNAVATEANRVGPNATGANGGLVLDQHDYNGSTYIWDMTDTIFYGNRCNGKTGTDYRVEKGSNVKGQPKPQYLLFEKATAYVEEETTSAYADVDPNARHYIFGDPLFVTPLPAAVEFDANYNPTWYADSAKTVTVSPADMDVHLQSTKGRWNGSDWVIDANYSPAIDAGCPDSGFAEEPECNGGRINLGAYGNTAEASKSYDVTEEAATLSGAAGLSEVKQLDNGHTVLIFSNVTDAASFTVAEGGIARILVVGGGGNGGGGGGSSYGGGGGGAGGVVERSAVMLSAGTYTVVVGGSHQDSVLKDSSGTALITASKGGNGGQGSGSAGENGGSGGGAGGHMSIYIDGGTGVPGQGNDGGSGKGYSGRGGGGYSESGNVGTLTNGGAGGGGYVSDITGEMRGYACGGGGGGNSGAPGGAGGCVTINGVRIKLGGDGTTRAVAEPGVAGTGSGGGGSDTANAGGRGGSGIVVVHLYSAWTPQFNVTLDPNGGTGGKTSVTATYGEDMPALDEGDLPARDGYKFAGYTREGWVVTKMTGEESDILTEGTTKYAYSACDAITLNGVKFAATLQSGTTSGSVTFNPGMAQADGGSGNAGKGDATAYGKLMKNKLRNDQQDSHTVTLGGLTANHTYLVQLICHEGNVANARGLSVDGHAYNCCQNGEDASQYGRSFVRCFKATAEGKYSFTLNKYGQFLQINALQVREIGGEDDSLLYYNDDGTSAKPWDILGDATLYAQWEVNTRHIERPTQGTASWTYDGQDHRPAYADTEGYTVAYSAAAPWKNAGTYRVTFTLKDNCEWADGTDVTSPIEFTYTITQREVTLGWGETSLTYNKTAQAPTCTAVSLVSGDSCTVTVTGQKTNVGTGYTATATGLSNSNYKLPSAKTTTFSIAKKALTVEGLKATDRPYDGTTTVAITGGTLKGVISGDTVTCEMPRSGTIADANVGTGKPVTYPALTLGESSAGNYSVTSPSLTVNITQATITGVTLTSASVTYDGQPHQPQVASVTANGKTFNSAITGWTVTYSRDDYTSVGTITVTVTGKANLTGSASTTFTITAKALTDTMVTLSASSFVYNGTNQKPTVTVTDGSKTLVENTDYTLTNAGGTDVGGDYEVQVVGKGNYSGTITKTFAITQAENTWTTVPAISKTAYKANDPATLTPGVPRFGTVAGTIAKDGGAAGTFSGSLPTEVGSYVLTYSVAETQNYTGLSETLNFTVTEAAYDLHAISGTGPVIKDVPSSWLAAAFPTAEKTQAAYQTEFLKVNASGVKAWQAYVLGFEGGQVATAKIAEETAQNADPATVTIRLANMPPLREGTGCTVKYSLYAATSTEDLMNDRGTVVTNLAEEAYYKWPESTFEAPLDDLTENEPVRYYRIKVHFTFGGGEPKPLDRTGYVQVRFNSTASNNLNYLQLNFKDEEGNYVSHPDVVSSGKDVIPYYCAYDGFNAGNNVLYETVYVAPPGVVLGNTEVSYSPSGATKAAASGATATYANMTLTAVNAETAMVECDKIWNEITGGDLTLWNGLVKTFITDRNSAEEWTRGLTKLQAALQPNSTTQCRILVLGDSLSADFYYGSINAMIESAYNTTNVSITCQQNNNHGCYEYEHFGDYNDGKTQTDCYYRLQHINFNDFDLVMFAGTTQLRGHTYTSGEDAVESVKKYITGTATGGGAGDRANPDCEFIMISPLISVDSRLDYGKTYGDDGTCYWGTPQEGGFVYWNSVATYNHCGQEVGSRTDWDYTLDPWMNADYNQSGSGLSRMRNKCSSIGIAYWDLTQLCYQYLYQSGKPFAYFNRDSQHSNRYGKQFAARVVFEVIKMICPSQS